MAVDLETLTMPAGVHAAVLQARDITFTRDITTKIIVWADHEYDRCPTCDQPVNRDPGCPVILNDGAPECPTQEIDQKHSCGDWLSVAWIALPGDATEDRIKAAATELHDGLTADLDHRRREIRKGLTYDLTDALARLAEPLEGDETAADREAEITSGSEVDAGVCRDDQGRWSAWAEDPDGSGDPIIVTQDDLD